MSQYSNMFTNPHPTFAPSIQAPIKLMNPGLLSKLDIAKQVKDQMSISEFGTKAGKEVAALADQVLQKTTTGKMGDFGDGITQILKLTERVKVDDLNINKNGGLFGKVTSFFKDKKVEVITNFESTQDSINKIVVDLNQRQSAMRSDNEFLDKLYDANLREYHELEESIEAANLMLAEMAKQHGDLKTQAEQSTDQLFIQSVNESEQRIKLWEKQIDRLKRMQQIALMTTVEIRQIQSSNVAMVEKFNDLVNTTIPAWGKQLTTTILKLKQKDNAELGNTIDDKTNAFFRKAAELNHQTAVAVAKSSERSVVDTETLEFMQNELLSSIREVKQIQEQGRQERISASTKIDGLRDQMKTEMLSWSR